MRFAISYLSCVAAAATFSPVVIGDAVAQHTASDPLTVEKSKFSLRQVENENYRGEENGLDARLWAYMKYGAELPESLKEAIRIGTHVHQRYKSLVNRGDDSANFGTVAAFPPQDIDIQYVVPVQIGTPEQTVFLNLDTGSGDLWTFSSDTPSWQVQDHIIYDPRASNTSMLQQGQRWRITYGDGSGAAGIVYTDRVAIGQTSFSKQAVESAQSVSGSFTRDSFSSGILGLGFGRGNTVRPEPVKTYFENIMSSLAAPVFTSNLQAGRPGNYNFGYVSTQEHVGPIAYTDVTRENPYWEVSIDGFRVGNGTYNETSLLERVVVDTGTTLLLVPDELVDAYYDQVDGASFEPSWGGYVFPCDAYLPDWAFGIGSYRGIVPGSFINYSPIGFGRCFGGIQSSEGIGFHLFGAMVLKAQFVVFDYVEPEVGAATPRVGFANKPLAV